MAEDKKEKDQKLIDLLALLEDKSEKGRALVEKSYHFSERAHTGHMRASGEPFFTHVYATAYALAEMGLDAQSVAAGLLHDSIEDVGVTEEDIEREFGPEVLRLVRGVTKLGALKYRGAQRHTESLRRLFIATSEDVRVLLIKLMDRLHNLRTLSFLPQEKQERIANETLEIYAPIADRLGMGRIKRELEDLSFPFLHPEKNREMETLVRERAEQSEERLTHISDTLSKALLEGGVKNFRMTNRVKGLYSLYKKLERKGMDIDKIHDILALRVIVSSLEDCYRALGVVHALWRPLPGKIKDYIAFPKPNGYQSLHTTVIAGAHGVLEIQIRTNEMHAAAQFGIASHLSYKELGVVPKDKAARANRLWLLELIPSLFRRVTPAGTTDTRKESQTHVPQWISELANAYSAEGSRSMRSFLSQIREDFFSHRVFVFTPKGDVVDLPLDSSPVDFAYAIHSDIGNHMAGAFVNNKMVTLDTKLKNGDIVKIETKPSAHPSRKWLTYAKTTLARRHIQLALRENQNV